MSGFGEPLVVPHPFITVLSCIRGLGGGLGLECRQEARTSGEVDTKLRVAEEQRGAGEPGPKERPCRLPGYYKPRGVANGAAVASPSGARKLRGTTFPGAASGSGSPRQPLKASARMRTPLPLPGRGHVRPAGIARSAAPGRRATGKHARPQRAHTPGHAHRRPGPRPPRPALPRAPPPPSRRRRQFSHWPHGL